MAFSAGDAGSIRDDLIRLSGNAVLAYCPEHEQAFADYGDGSWAVQYAAIHGDAWSATRLHFSDAGGGCRTGRG